MEKEDIEKILKENVFGKIVTLDKSLEKNIYNKEEQEKKGKINE